MAARAGRTGLWLHAALVGSSLLVACSIATSLDGLSGGASGGDSGAEGATGPVTSQPPPDATPSTFPEAGGPDADAGTPDAGRWCESLVPQPQFCADFDENGIGRGYSSGTPVLLSAPSVCPKCTAQAAAGGRSPPNAFVTAVPSNTGLVEVAARFDEQISAPGTRATLRFDMQVLEIAVGYEVDFAALYLRTPSASVARAYVVWGRDGAGMLSVDKGSGSTNETLFPFPGDGAWHTYQLDLDPEPITAHLVIDGKNPLDVALATSCSPSSATFGLGADVYPTSTDVKVAFDNVTLTTH
jgi:hypothetical protein